MLHPGVEQAKGAAMRILMLTQWFQPEPNFKGLPLAKALIERGHQVEVLTGFPNYPGGKLYPGYRIKPWQRETMDGVAVLRAPLYPSHDQSALRRIFNYASFAASSAILALTMRRPDVVYVYCPPMTAAAGALGLTFLRRVPYVIDIQDLWPETLASTGMVRSGAIMRVVGWWSGLAMRHAARLVVLSPGFTTRLKDRGVAVPIDIIPNWAPPEIVEQARRLPPAAYNGTTFTVLFAGNMGRAQALNTALDAAAILQRDAPHVRLALIGGGVQAEDLKTQAEARKLTNVSFLPPRPVEKMGEVFGNADALLVHLRDDPLFAITIPSKTQAYLAIGKPILMGVRGDAAAMVEDAAAGLTFAPEDAEAMASAITALSRMTPERRAAMGAAGAAYYASHLTFQTGVTALEEALLKATNAG